MSEKTRYTDEELEEFKTLILQKLEKSKKKKYESLRADVMNSDGNDTSDTSPTFKVLEEGASTLSKRSRPYGNAPGSVYKAFTRCISTH